MVFSMSNIEAKVKSQPEATTRAINIYRAGRTMFPGIDTPLKKEANWEMVEVCKPTKLDLELLAKCVFWDTVVVSCYLPAVPENGKKDTKWAVERLYRGVISRAFPGISCKIKKSEDMPMDKDGNVKFRYTLKTASWLAQEGFELLQEIKAGNKVQDGVGFKLEDADLTVNVPGYVYPGYLESLANIVLPDGRVLEPNSGLERKHGLQCPSWALGSGLYFKLYAKLAFMLVSTGVNGKGGSQLHQILKSDHGNIDDAFHNEEFQEKGFARAELRFTASSLPGTLEEATGMLLGLLGQAAEQRLTERSLDVSVQRYLAKDHKYLVYLEDTGFGYWKVVVVRWMDKLTGCCNTQSLDSAGIKSKDAPKSLVEAVHLAYQWVPGNASVVAVVVGVDGGVVNTMQLPATGLVASVLWDNRKAAERQMVTSYNRGLEFKDVGMPSFWLDNPKKRVPVQVVDSAMWWAKAKAVKVNMSSPKQVAERKRLWVVTQNKRAKVLLAQLVFGLSGLRLGAPQSMDKVKSGAVLLVVKTGADTKYGKPVFLASDGNTYRLSAGMQRAGMGKLVASRECPLVFVRGAKTGRTMDGKSNVYGSAKLLSWSRDSVGLVSDGLTGLFFTADDYERYGDIVM
jgi:hypothetical protein